MIRGFHLLETVVNKLSPKEVHARRKEYARFKTSYIKWVAYKGGFDEILPEKDIRIAQKGHLPSYLDVHHIMPLGLGGNNSFSNLLVIDKSTHKKIHKFYESQDLTNDTLYLLVPDTEMVASTVSSRVQLELRNKRTQPRYRNGR